MKPFDIEDYPLSSEQPPPSNYVVVPVDVNGNALTSVEAVNADIVSRIPDDNSSGDVPYLMNCSFEDVPYLADTFSGIGECVEIAEVNALVNSGNNANYRFKIGNYYYKFSLSTTETSKIHVSCVEGLILAGAPMWTRTS